MVKVINVLCGEHNELFDVHWATGYVMECIYLFKKAKEPVHQLIIQNIHIICPASIQIGLKIVKRARLNYVRLQIIPSNLYTAGKNSLQQSR